MDFQALLSDAREKKTSVGVCVRVRYNDAFLLLRRAEKDEWPGIWELPGGSLENGESLEEGAARELFEESGITVRPSDLSGLNHFEFQNKETDAHKIKFAFDAHMKELCDIRLSPDHSEALFMTRVEIERLPREDKDEPYALWVDHYNILMS